MNNMLYTSCVTKNLLSMSQFSKDNQVYFEFHVSHCIVKGSISHRTLLKGFEFGGLYKIDLSTFVSFGRVSQFAYVAHIAKASSPSYVP